MRRALALLVLALVACSGSPPPKKEAGPAARDAPDVARGERWYEKLACGSCHRANGGAPALLGRAGPAMLEGGSGVAFDEAYVRESIVSPDAKVSKGHSAEMPSYRGQLSEEDLRDLVAYVLAGR